MAKKGFYWNRRAVANAIGRVNAEFLFAAGAFVRSRARSSMKKGRLIDGSRVHAPPGKAPYRYGNQLYDFMLYSFDPVTNTMVIGPKFLPGRKSGRGGIPNVLETGGQLTVTRTVASGSPRRRWGPKHYEGGRPRTKHRLPSGETSYRYFRSRDAWCRARQRAAFQAWARGRSEKVSVRVNINPHPYMSSALRQVLSERVMNRLYEKAAQRAYR